MTRTPDKNAKTSQIIVQAKTPEEEKKIRALKEICIRNSLTIRNEMFALLDYWLLGHHWPATDGHSQYQITEFTLGRPQRSDQCNMCEAKPVYRAFLGKKSVLLCEEHFEQKKSWFTGWKKL